MTDEIPIVKAFLKKKKGRIKEIVIEPLNKHIYLKE